MQKENKQQEELDEYDLLYEKVPARYKDLYDSDDFEKFHRGKEWSE